MAELWTLGSTKSMAKKIIFTLIWALVFAFGSAMLMGFLSGLFPGVTSFSFGLWGLGLANLFGLIGLLLGICGKLPGTQRQMSK